MPAIFYCVGSFSAKRSRQLRIFLNLISRILLEFLKLFFLSFFNQLDTYGYISNFIFKRSVFLVEERFKSVLKEHFDFC